jgi:hypothetical protein
MANTTDTAEYRLFRPVIGVPLILYDILRSRHCQDAFAPQQQGVRVCLPLPQSFSQRPEAAFYQPQQQSQLRLLLRPLLSALLPAFLPFFFN